MDNKDYRYLTFVSPGDTLNIHFQNYKARIT